MESITTYYYHLKKQVKENPSKIYLQEGEKTYSYLDVYRKVNQTRYLLKRYGIEKKTAALRTSFTVETLFLLFALLSLNNRIYLTDSHQKVNEFFFDKPHIPKPYVSFSDEESLGHFELLHQELRIPLALTNEEEKEEPDTTGEEGNLVIFTSGSTGTSKAFLQSEANFIRNALETKERGDYRKEDKALFLVPLNHVFGLALITTGLVLSHTLCFGRSKKIEDLSKDISYYGITRLNGVPTTYLSLIEQAKGKKNPYPTLRCGFVGGAPLSKEQFLRIEQELSLRLIPVYGMSECIGITCSYASSSQEERFDNVGPCYEGTTIRLVKNNKDCLPSETGEIFVKGDMLMKGYLGKEEESFDKNGYFETGDLGYFDSNKNLHIVGRIKNIINRGGQKIPVEEVEKKILTLPYVLDCCIVPKKDSRLGEVPALALVLKEQEDDATIKKDVSRILLKNEIPEAIEIVSSLPLNPNGKLDRKKIAEWF